ncbi:hypothetical protein, partial [Plasmodium yoelii yoelii]
MGCRSRIDKTTSSIYIIMLLTFLVTYKEFNYIYNIFLSFNYSYYLF